MSAAAQFSSRWSTDDVPGMGSITGERRSSQARHTWETVAPSCWATWSSGPPGRDSFPLASGNHGMKPIRCSLAVVDDVVGAAVGDVVLVLHADHRHDPPGRLDLGHAHLGQPDLGHLALVAQLLQEPELVVGRHLGVDPVQLEQIDALDPEAAEAALALLAQVLGAAALDPLHRARTGEPGLGGDLQVAG